MKTLEEMFPTLGDAHKYCTENGLDISITNPKIFGIAYAIYKVRIDQDKKTRELLIERDQEIGFSIVLENFLTARDELDYDKNYEGLSGDEKTHVVNKLKYEYTETAKDLDTLFGKLTKIQDTK